MQFVLRNGSQIALRNYIGKISDFYINDIFTFSETITQHLEDLQN